MKTAVATFIKDGDLYSDNRALVRLRIAGWTECIPTEWCWHFIHPDFPGYRVDWHFDGRVKATPV